MRKHILYDTVKQLRKFSFDYGIPSANVHRCLPAGGADVLKGVTADGSAHGQGPWDQTNKLSVES